MTLDNVKQLTCERIRNIAINKDYEHVIANKTDSWILVVLCLIFVYMRVQRNYCA